MTYLVLYRLISYTGTDLGLGFKEISNKSEAIEFARENNGAIVEAFEFDIKKEVKE